MEAEDVQKIVAGHKLPQNIFSKESTWEQARGRYMTEIGGVTDELTCNLASLFNESGNEAKMLKMMH